MKLARTFIAPALLGLLAACSSSGTQDAQEPADAAPRATAAAPAATAAPTDATGAPDATAMSDMNWFGGPIYTGEPALEATAALIAAGGGVDDFDFQTALVSMLGEETVDAEAAKLTEQYGADEVTTFLDGMTFAVNAAIGHVTDAGVTLPEAPADLVGVDLAKAMVEAGVAPDGLFWSGYLFDKTLSNAVHVQVMVDIEQEFDHETDEITHKILNQAMYDVAQALGMEGVGLAPLH